MIDAVTATELVHHAGHAPGEFPTHWHDAAYDLHCRAWARPWEGRLQRDRFLAELDADHVDVLYEPDGRGGRGALLAYIKWKATTDFHLSRDELSDPAYESLPSAPPARYVCAYEITATPDRAWHGLGRRLLSETVTHWERTHPEAVFCTYSPKRRLTHTLRQLAAAQQYDRSALELFAHRARAAAARHIDEWTERLEQSLASFIRTEIIPVPDQRMMTHLAELAERYGNDVINGIVAAMGIAYQFVLRASSGLPACGPTAFHRLLGAEHWRQYPHSAMNCADALGLVDHWRYSSDSRRRERCARLFKGQRAARAQQAAGPHDLFVLA
ncbi:MAG: hypothetical protein JSU68_13745 [Phycisphaerales bacterium]|nr:MAG: hypothetical protein JSU68_13745 [Phycisphaerales bacterium]